MQWHRITLGACKQVAGSAVLQEQCLKAVLWPLSFVPTSGLGEELMTHCCAHPFLLARQESTAAAWVSAKPGLNSKEVLVKKRKQKAPHKP